VETGVNGDGSITRVDGEVGSIAEIAKRGKLHKPEIRGMEAALAMMKEEQSKNPSPERETQIKDLGELLERLNSKDEKVREAAHRGMADACRRQLEKARGEGGVGGEVAGKAGRAGSAALGIGILAGAAMLLIRQNEREQSPYVPPTLRGGA
jgi:hypothetical protein